MKFLQAYGQLTFKYLFICIYIDCKQLKDYVTSSIVIASQLRSLLGAFLLPRYLIQGCSHVAQDVAVTSSPL